MAAPSSQPAGCQQYSQAVQAALARHAARHASTPLSRLSLPGTSTERCASRQHTHCQQCNAHRPWSTMSYLNVLLAALRGSRRLPLRRSFVQRPPQVVGAVMQQQADAAQR